MPKFLSSPRACLDKFGVTLPDNCQDVKQADNQIIAAIRDQLNVCGVPIIGFRIIPLDKPSTAYTIGQDGIIYLCPNEEIEHVVGVSNSLIAALKLRNKPEYLNLPVVAYTTPEFINPSPSLSIIR